MRLPTASVAFFILYLQQVKARHVDKDQYARNLRSIYRKSQFEEFGGREWQHILLALGDVDQEMVTIVNTIVRRSCRNAEQELYLVLSGRSRRWASITESATRRRPVRTQGSSTRS